MVTNFPIVTKSNEIMIIQTTFTIQEQLSDTKITMNNKHAYTKIYQLSYKAHLIHSKLMYKQHVKISIHEA